MAWRRLRALLAATIVAAALAPATRGSARAASTAAPVPPGVRAVEAMRFPSLVTALSAGPHPGDVALTLANGTAEVVEDGRVTAQIPARAAADVAWVPGTGWVASASPPQRGTSRYFLTDASSGARVALPACAGSGGQRESTQVGALRSLPGAVAWICPLPALPAPITGGPSGSWTAFAVEVLRIPAQGPVRPQTATRFVVHAVPPSAPFAVAPGASAAAVESGGAMRVFALPGGAPEAGVLPLGGLGGTLAWLRGPTLAVADPSGLYLWNRGAPTEAAVVGLPDARVRWIAPVDGGNAALVLDQLSVGAPPVYALERVTASGEAQVLLRGRLGYVLGPTAAGTRLWREEGVAMGVYDRTDPQPGPGPFRLEAVPVPASGTPALAAQGGASGLGLGVTMATPAVGWATADSSLVLRTIDGGAHWTDVSPPPAPRPHYTGFLQVLGPDTVVVTEEPATSTPPDTAALLAVTVDGGRTWRTATLPGAARDYDLAWFANARDGWVSSSGRKGYALYTTSDGGRRWTLRVDMVPGAGVGSAGLPASDADVSLSFAGSRVGWALGADAAAGGSVVWWLYATRDGGDSWGPVRLPVPAALRPYGPPQPELPHCFSGGACVLTAGFGSNRTEVYTSSDDGRTWQPAPAAPTATSFMEPVALLSPRDWILGDATHLYLTRDAGRRWTTRSFPLGLHAGGNLQFLSRSEGWMVGVGSGSASVLWRTRDGGRSWQAVFPAQPPPSGRDAATEPGPLGRIVMTGPATGWWLGAGGIFWTTDGGATWTDVSPPGLRAGDSLARDRDAALAACTGGAAGAPATQGSTPAPSSTSRSGPSASAASAATATGASATTGGFRSSLSSTAPPSGTLPAAAASPRPCAERAWVALTNTLGATTVWSTRDAGGSWTAAPVPAPPGLVPLAVSFPDPAHGFLLLGGAAACGSAAPVVYATADGGAHWAPLAGKGLPADTLNVGFVTPTFGWAAGARDLAFSRDGGTTWTPLGLHLPEPPTPGPSVDNYAPFHVQFFSANVGVVSVDTQPPRPPGSTFAGTFGQHPTLVIEQTADGGRTWAQTGTLTDRSGTGFDGHTWWATFVSPTDGWAADGPYAKRTLDGGRAWQALRTYPPGSYMFQLDFLGPRLGWSASGAQVLTTVNGGQSWRLLGAQFLGIGAAAGAVVLPADPGCACNGRTGCALRATAGQP